MSYHKNIFRIGSLCIVAILLLPALGCAKMTRKLKKKLSGPFIDYNYPYEPDTPAPAPHDGTFISDHGTMTFNGDGTSVVIDFDAALAKAVGLSAGKQDMRYEFLSGDLAPHGKIPVRYDVAMYLSMYAKEGSSNRRDAIAVGVVGENGSKSTGTGCTTADRITFIDVDLDGKPGVNFVKSKAAVKTGTQTASGTSAETDSKAATSGTASAPASKDAALIEKAKKHSGAPEAELEWNPDGTATIHLFETVDDGDGDSHVSTWDWYTIDPDTMTGTDFMEMPVDLN
ncbi:MAG: hypothetical protein J6Y13_02435 [Treponema sp.]|nr:hypothetical protein [Treponema sp.]